MTEHPDGPDADEQDARKQLLTRFAADLESGLFNAVRARGTPGADHRGLLQVGRGRANGRDRTPPADDPTPPITALTLTAPGQERMPRRRLAVVVACVAVSGAVAVGAVRLLDHSERDTAVPTMASSPPADSPEPGIDVAVTVDEDGTQRVTQWVRSDYPMSLLALRTPQVGTSTTQPTATHVSVSGAGGTVPGERTIDRDTSTYYLTRPSRSVRITYTMTGSIVTSPTKRGRALVTAAGLEVDNTTGWPRRIRVSGPRVLSMACVPPDPQVPRPCGEPAVDGWQVVLTDRHADERVTTQIDL